MAMLDLQAFQSQTFEVKLFDGEVINLQKPSQRLVLDIVAYEEKMKDKKNMKKVIESFASLIMDILNTNVEGKKFNREYVETYFNFEVGMMFVQGYMEFVQEVNSNPN